MPAIVCIGHLFLSVIDWCHFLQIIAALAFLGLSKQGFSANTDCLEVVFIFQPYFSSI